MHEFILLVLFNVSMVINYIVKYMIMYLFDFYKYGIDNRNIFFCLFGCYYCRKIFLIYRIINS